MSDSTVPPADLSFDRRKLLSAAAAAMALELLPIPSTAAPPKPKDIPPFAQRGLPGTFQAALDPLQGKWKVEKKIFIAIGTKEHPAVSSGMTCTRRWIAGQRHLEDVTTGTLGGGAYYRLGVLGFSNIDRQYEWATFDALNSNMMIYHSVPMDAPSHKIVLTGTFTDQGLLGESSVGKSVPMRTNLEILGPDRHIIDLTFMPPGEPEILIDHSTYTRA
jgi:uncharacterized protein DUF1579